jgi:hypothetical protein
LKNYGLDVLAMLRSQVSDCLGADAMSNLTTKRPCCHQPGRDRDGHGVGAAAGRDGPAGRGRRRASGRSGLQRQEAAAEPGGVEPLQGRRPDLRQGPEPDRRRYRVVEDAAGRLRRLFGDQRPDLGDRELQQLEHEQIFSLAASLVYSIGIRIGIVLLVLAIVDYAYQRYKIEQELKMTKQEVKDEMRRMDGDPKIKQRRLQMARQMMKEQLKEGRADGGRNRNEPDALRRSH